jgi:hypothetical protein
VRVLLFSLFFVSLASQASALMFCNRPMKVSIPSGNYTDFASMERAQRDVESYFEKMKDYVDCIQNEINDSIDEANRTGDEWERAIDAFNN